GAGGRVSFVLDEGVARLGECEHFRAEPRAFATYVRIFMTKDGGNSRSSTSSMLCTFADVSSERHPAPHDHVRVRGRLPSAYHEPRPAHALLELLVGHALGAGEPGRARSRGPSPHTSGSS